MDAAAVGVEAAEELVRGELGAGGGTACDAGGVILEGRGATVVMNLCKVGRYSGLVSTFWWL